MLNSESLEQLLDAKDRIIAQQQEQIELLKELAEARRVAYVNQTKELAERRQFDMSYQHRWGFFCWLVFRHIWPFSLFWNRVD